MNVLGHFKTKFKDAVNHFAIKNADRKLCELLAEKSGLNFKASIEACEYMGDPTADVLFSCQPPKGLAEDLSRCLRGQTGLRFETSDDKVYLAIGSAWMNSYCYGASFNDLQDGINRIDQKELKDIVIEKTRMRQEEQTLQVA